MNDAFPPEPTFPAQETDAFDHRWGVEPGFCDLRYTIVYRVAGGDLIDLGARKLPAPVLSMPERVALQQALVLTSPDAHLYVAQRHFYVGIPVVTVAVQVGPNLPGRMLLEEQDSDASGFIIFRCEGRGTAMAALSGPGRAMMERLCSAAMDEVLAKLRAKETRL